MRVSATGVVGRASDYLCANIRRLTVRTPKAWCARLTSALRTKAGTVLTPLASSFNASGEKTTTNCHDRRFVRRVYSWTKRQLRRRIVENVSTGPATFDMP